MASKEMISLPRLPRLSEARLKRLHESVLVFALVLSGFLFVLPRVYAAQIWMAASEPVWRTHKGWPQNDYLDLFRNGAAWQNARSHVSVLELSRLAAIETTDHDLDMILSSLRQSKIKLAVEAAHMLSGRDCEGSRAVDELVAILTRVKQHGGEVDYIAMDEPLWFNHAFVKGRPGSSPCVKSIDDLARLTAVKMKAARAIFPGVAIGDVEPMGVPPDTVAEWPNDIQRWLSAYQQAMGEKLAFFQTDVVWIRPSWKTMLTSVAPIIRNQRIPLGIIYNGTPNDLTDADWVTGAQQHYQLVEGQLHILPDQAMFQTWMDRPRAMLPETSASSFTSLIDDYLNWNSKSH